MTITEILGLYGAGLSTLVFVWNVLRAMPRVKVGIVNGSHSTDGKYIQGVFVSVRNPSPRTVHLAQISILYPDRDPNWFDIIKWAAKFRRLPSTVGWVHVHLADLSIDDKCPVALEAGSSHEIFVPKAVLEDLFEDSIRREIRAVAMDQLWRNKYSRKFSGI